MKIGVLSLQGASREHIAALEQCGVQAVEVKKSSQLKGLDGLVIPGGESTTISKLVDKTGLGDAIVEMAVTGKPILGTCAGLILLSQTLENGLQAQHTLGLLDVTVSRNAFGRQQDSFETDLQIPVLGEDPFRAVFIRAPLITSCGEGVEVLAAYGEGVVAARKGNLLVTAFHPELTEDLRLHKYFLQMTN